MARQPLDGFGFRGSPFGMSAAARMGIQDRQVAAPRQPSPTSEPLPPEQSESMRDQLLHTGASGLSYVLGTLDKPGQAARGLLAGKGVGSLKHLIPFADSAGLIGEKDQTTGRDLTNQLGITQKTDKGWGAWGAGLAAEVATDPLNAVTFGPKAATNAAGRALGKIGALQGISRRQLLRGVDATESGLTALGRTGPEITHLRNQGKWIPGAAAETAAASAGRPLQARQPLSSLMGVGLPFGKPLFHVGTGPAAQTIAGGMDKAGDFLRFGNPLGRAIGANFDASVKGATDAITQRGMAKYGTPTEDALRVQSRQNYANIAQRLDPLIKAGTHPEADIISAARMLAEGAPTGHLNPALVQQVHGLAGDLTDIGRGQFAQARAAGVPLSDLADEFVNYVPRQINAAGPSGQQIGIANQYPVTSRANRSRQVVFRDVPGGTEAIEGWVGNPNLAGKTRAYTHEEAARQVLTEMVNTAQVQGKTLDPMTLWGLHGKAGQLSSRLKRLSPEHIQGGLFNKNLPEVMLGRGEGHARTLASANAAIGTIGDNLKALADLPGSTPMKAKEFLRAAKYGRVEDLANRLLFPDQMAKALGLKTYAADAATGTPIQGALVKLHNAAARLGAGPTEQLLMGSPKEIARELRNFGMPAPEFHRIAKAYGQWNTPESVKAPLKFFDSATNAFKSLAYPLWPAAHVRNAASAALNNTNAGVGTRDYLLQAGVMRNTATAKDIAAALPGLPPGLTDEAARDWLKGQQYAHAQVYGGQGMTNELLNGMPPGPASTPPPPPGRITSKPPGSEIPGQTGSFLGDTGALLGGGVLDTARGMLRKNPMKGLEMRGVAGGTKDFPALAAGRTVSSNIEDFFRGSQFNARLRQGFAPQQAAADVAKYHFDYGKLTPFERNVMKRLVPFYTFSRKNLPLQLQTLMNHPGVSATQLRPTGVDPNQYTPQYLQSGVAIPTGPERDGRQQYISSLGLPIEEALERLHFKNGLPDLKRTALAYLGSTNPLLKGPAEQLFDTQFHTGRKLSDLRPQGLARQAGHAIGDDNPQLLAQFLANTPLTRFVSTFDKVADDRKGPLAKAANLLTGVKVSDVDVEKTRAIEARNALMEKLVRDPMMKTFTDAYPRPETRANLSREQIDQLRLKSEMEQRARAYAEARRKAGQ